MGAVDPEMGDDDFNKNRFWFWFWFSVFVFGNQVSNTPTHAHTHTGSECAAWVCLTLEQRGRQPGGSWSAGATNRALINSLTLWPPAEWRLCRRNRA